MAVAPVHRVGARCERLAGLAAIRGVASVLAVDDIAGDGQNRLGVHRAAIGRVLADLLHEGGDEVGGDAVDAIIVVAVHREIAGRLVTHDEAVVAPDGPDFRVLDRGEAVRHDGEAGDAESHRAQDLRVVQRHLEALVEVLVVHVVNTVHRMHVGSRQPLHHHVELCHHVVELEHVASDRGSGRGDLVAADLVTATIDGVEQTLAEIDPGAEELHLIADAHCRNAAGDAVIVTPIGPHEVVVLVLDRRRLGRHLDAVALERLGKLLRPKHGDVRLRRRAESS